MIPTKKADIIKKTGDMVGSESLLMVFERSGKKQKYEAAASQSVSIRNKIGPFNG